MSDASPVPKRARLSESESQASNVVPPQIYRMRVTLPSYRGFRIFDVPESASFHELHLHSGEAFNREPDSHCYQFEHPSLVFFHSPPESLAPRRRRVSTVHPSFDRVSPRGCAHDNETPPPRPVPRARRRFRDVPAHVVDARTLEAMGGGNAQKSATARKKALEKAQKAAAGSQLKSNAKAMSTICQVCRASFMCTLAPSKLKEHSDNKHPKQTFEMCFPGVTL